jgi:flagellar protein FlbD
MIQVTRFNGAKIYLNAEMVQTVEETPDTIITLTNKEKILVREKSIEVVKRILEYRRLIQNPQIELNLGK